MKRKELVEKLELVSRALADNSIIPIFTCFCFDGRMVKAYNDSLAIIAPCASDESFCVNGQTLLGLLSNSHAEEVEFKIVDQDLVISTGRSVFKLPWFPVEDFLFKAPTAKASPRIGMTQELIDGLTACLMTVSKDTAQAGLMGVRLTDYKQLVTFYSTDGDAISRYISGVGPTTKSFNHMMPTSFCDTVVKLFNDFESKQAILGISEEWATCGLNGDDNKQYQVLGRLLVPDNPIDHEEWIKKTIKDKPQFQDIPKGLNNALSRARVIADPESAKTVLTIKDNKMLIRTETSMGQVRDTVAVGQDDVVANVSAELMQRCVSLTEEVAILENCCVFRAGSKLFILTSNMGE